jgi:hypothetical protein
VASERRTAVAGTWERDEGAVAWVYGSILVGAAVVVASGVVASAPGQVLVYTAATMVIVWLAHSYAAFVGHGGRVDIGGVHMRLAAAMRIELPVLASSVPTLIVLAVCWLVGTGLGPTGLIGLIAADVTMALVAGGAARRAGAGYPGIAAAVLAALVIGTALIAAKVSLK